MNTHEVLGWYMLACAHPADRVDSPFVGGLAVQPTGGPFCYAKRPQKPTDHDLHVGERHRHDRPGAYGHAANESVPLAYNCVVPNWSPLACRPRGQSSDTGELAPSLRVDRRRWPDWLKIKNCIGCVAVRPEGRRGEKNNGCRML